MNLRATVILKCSAEQTKWYHWANTGGLQLLILHSTYVSKFEVSYEHVKLFKCLWLEFGLDFTGDCKLFLTWQEKMKEYLDTEKIPLMLMFEKVQLSDQLIL